MGAQPACCLQTEHSEDVCEAAESRDSEPARASAGSEPYPPSKWNKIEHRLFSFISKNWRGQPLTSLKVIVSLIAGTTTRKGLRVHAEIDDRPYPTGTKVPDAQMAEIRLQRDDFHGEWNYEILP